MIWSSSFEKIIYGVKFCTEVWTLLKKRRQSRLLFKFSSNNVEFSISVFANSFEFTISSPFQFKSKTWRFIFSLKKCWKCFIFWQFFIFWQCFYFFDNFYFIFDNFFIVLTIFFFTFIFYFLTILLFSRIKMSIFDQDFGY